MAVQIKAFAFNPFQENTYILHDSTGEAVVIDPGCHTPKEEQALAAYILQHGLAVKYLLNTHCHIDHVLGNAYIKRKFGLELYGHELERAQLAAVQSYAPNYGFPEYQPSEMEHLLREGDEVTFGETVLQVLFVPGHSPGHLVFYHAEGGFAIAGDVLFKGSIGRTDLPGGDHEQLLQAIKDKMFVLPDATVVWPGHGPETTIGYEKRYNPFVGQMA